VSNHYVVSVRRSLRWWLAVLAPIVLLPLTVTAPSNPAAASTHSSCHAPRMIGLTVAAARARATSSGCSLRLTGAAVQMPKIQTIRAQSSRPGRSTKLLSVTVNPPCPGVAEIGPPPGEPLLKPGPTELDTGLFFEGGPLIYRSAPVCKDFAGKSSAGNITVTNFAGTAVANNVALSAGQLLEITLSAGNYTITGVFADGSAVGPTTVTVPTGEVVRQDLVLDVP